MNTFGSMISDEDAKKLNMAINSEKNVVKEPQKKLEKKIVKQIVGKKPELAITQPEKTGIIYERNKDGKLEKKVHGAGRELARQITLAKSVEDNLSSGLETNKRFTKKAKIIDNKRVLVFERTKQLIDDINNDKPDRGVVDMAALQEAMKELEADLTDPYVKLVYSKLADMNKFILLDQLHDEGATPDENKIISFDTISPSQFNVIYYSDSGFLMQITNPDEVNNLITDDRARYNIIAPNGSVVAENIDFQQAQTQFEDLSGTYQKDLKEEFNGQQVPEKTQELEAKIDNVMAEMEADEKSAQEQVLKYNVEKEAMGVTAANLEYQEKPLEPVINEEFIQQVPEKTQELESKIDDMMADMEADEKSAQEQLSKYNSEKEALGVTAPNLEYQEKPLVPVVNTDELLETLYNKPETTSDQETDALLETLYNKPEVVANSETDALIETLFDKPEASLENPVNTETPVVAEPIVVAPLPNLETPNESGEKKSFHEEVAYYAEKMGIDESDLAKHPEFVELNAAQQLFVLEALNRASLSKIKVEANANFLAEKENKKWYQLGFGLNQKFHKKKHEVLVAKDIHSKGLEGYGEAEFTWLIDVIKKGPEIIVDEDGEVDSVNYLQVEVDADPVRQKLIDKYNYEAYHLSNTPVGSENYQTYSNDVKVAREALLASAKDEWEAAELVTKLIEAEKQLKLHHFIKSDSNNEKIIQGLVDKNLGSWQKFGMMMAGQKDKAAYMGIGAVARLGLRSELATAVIGKSFTYAVGPLVAAAIGGWRANSRARAGLAEQNELAQLGVESQDKKIKTLNLAVGSEKSEKKDGQVINIGLADKLESLMDKCNSFANEINKLESITRTSKQEEELENMHTEQRKFWDRLSDRIEYTSRKMEDGLVSYGEPSERAMNYYRLLNSLEDAKFLVFDKNQIIDDKAFRPNIDGSITELTRSNKKTKNISDNEGFKRINAKLSSSELSSEDREKLEAEKQLMVRTWYKLDQLSSLSVAQRLASFLNFKEDQRESAEFKYLVRQTAGGAVMGATFAAVGAWIFEQTGLDHVISNKINQLGRLTHADQAFNWISGLFAADQASGGKVAEKIVEVVSADESVVSNQEVVSDYSASESAEPAASIEPTEATEAAATPESQATEQVVGTTAEKVKPAAAAEAQTATQAAAESTSKTYSREISNKPGQSNSVWRSLREIFKSNSQALGYQGDINDTDALNRWAENQTANAINNSGDVTDKVFEGNKVSLLQENGEFKVSIEAGDGLEPGYLDNEAEIDTNETASENVVEDLDENESTPKPEITTINSETIILKAPAAPETPETVVDNSKAINELAKIFHLAPEDIKTVGSEVVYEGKSGKIVFDTVKNTIKEVFDTNNKVIPQEFVDELRGRASMDKFVNRGGLEKIFSVWSKLGVNDKIVYESLHLFNLSPTNELKLTPEALINKISGLFNVVAKDVAIDVDAKQFVLGNREFKMDLDGVNKLVKVLSRRFGA